MPVEDRLVPSELRTLLFTDRFRLGLQPQQLITTFHRTIQVLHKCDLIEELEDEDWRSSTLASINDLHLLKTGALIQLSIYLGKGAMQTRMTGRIAAKSACQSVRSTT
jgi:hypothetical protein